jgi:hypothetical protein
MGHIREKSFWHRIPNKRSSTKGAGCETNNQDFCQFSEDRLLWLSLDVPQKTLYFAGIFGTAGFSAKKSVDSRYNLADKFYESSYFTCLFELSL